jgi:hypothetical protein
LKEILDSEHAIGFIDQDWYPVDNGEDRAATALA